MFKDLVAWISNLLYRRFLIGRISGVPAHGFVRGGRRLETRDTADWKSALRSDATDHLRMHRVPTIKWRPWPALLVGLMLTAFSSAGCRTASPLPPVNLSDPGWSVRQGQAVWRPRKGAPELAGELLVAAHASGRSFVQFTKTPLPFVTAQTTATNWQIHFAPRNVTLRGHGRPRARFLWLHLARCLSGAAPPRGWSGGHRAGNAWRFENVSTGEALEGYLTP